MTDLVRAIFAIGLGVLVLGRATAGAGDSAEGEVHVHRESANRDGPVIGKLFPHGPHMHIGGYSPSHIESGPDNASSVIDRMAKAGFTVAGPWYGTHEEARPMMLAARKSGMRLALHAGSLTLLNDAKRDEFVHLLASDAEKWVNDSIDGYAAISGLLGQACCWFVLPEELRSWRQAELQYLETVSGLLRQDARTQLPVTMYEPNHRTGIELAKTGQYQDLLIRGAYVSHLGWSKDRATHIKWAMAEAREAARSTGQTIIAALELSQDLPGYDAATLKNSPAKAAELTTLLRHDVFLAVTEGAKGVHLWSMWHKREELTTFDPQFEAYAEAVRDLRRIERAILFGLPDPTLSIQTGSAGQCSHENKVGCSDPGKLLNGAGDNVSTLVRTIDGYTTLLAVNSRALGQQVAVFGIPEGKDINGNIAGKQFHISSTGDPVQFEIPAFGVAIIRLDPQGR